MIRLLWPRLWICGGLYRQAWCMIALACVLQGCAALNSSTSTTAPKAQGSIVTVDETLDAAGKPTKRLTTTKSAEAVGTGATASGDKVNQAMSGQPANITVDGIAATGGGGSTKTSATGEMTGLKSPLLWVGIVCLLLAGVSIWRGWTGLIIPAAGAGVIFIAIAFYPWILLWGVLALVVIVGGPYVWTAIQAKRSHEALRAVVAGVAAAPTTVQEAVKDEISKHAEAADKDEITRVKRADGLV